MKGLAINTDHVVCLALETTQPSSGKSNYRRIFTDDRLSTLSKGQCSEQAQALDLNNLQAYQKENVADLPRIVHLDWTICSVKDFKVLEVASIFINPDQPIDETTANFTGLTQDVISKDGVSFSTAIDKFKQSLKAVVGDKTHKLVTYGDWICKYQLPLEAARTGTDLQGLFADHANLLELHYELTPEKSVKDLPELMRINELEPIHGPTRAKTDCQSIVRLINRMIRQYKVSVEVEKGNHQQTGGFASHNSNESTEDSKNVEECSNSVRRRSRSRSSEQINPGIPSNNSSAPITSKPIEFKDADMCALKLRGIPFQGQVSDVVTFFQKWSVEEERVDMINRPDGRFSGIAFVLFNSVDEATEALNEMQGQNIGHRWIEIFPITYQEFQNKSAGGRESNRGGQQEDVLLSKFLNPSNVNRCCKLGGLPFRVRTEEIQEFFKDFNVSGDDVVIEQQGGKRTGYGLVFLQNEDQVDEAISSLHRQYIGNRFVNVWQAELRRGGNRNQDADDY